MTQSTLRRPALRGAVAAALAAATLLASAPEADALKLYRDNETGIIYASPGENREEYKPFGLDIGFLFFLEYRSELEDRDQPAGTAYAGKATTTAPYDAFAATRTVIDFKRSFTKTTRGRLVLDNRGATNGTGSYDVYIRHVIGEVDFPSMNSTFSFGELSTPTVSFEDGFWGNRVQGTNFFEREGVFTSGDWGIGWLTKFQSVPLEWYTTLTNGEGRTTAEANIGKSIETRLSWKTPIDGLSLTSGYQYSWGGNFVGTPNTGVGIRQDRIVGSIHFKKPFWRIGANYMYARDEANSYANAALLLNNGSGNMNRQSIPVAGYALTEIASRGGSVSAVVDVPGTDWSLIGRYDYYQPGTFYRDNEHTRWLAGPVYTLNENMRFLLTYEALDFTQRAEQASGNRTANSYDQSRILLQSEIKF
jgi:hypothetical protein